MPARRGINGYDTAWVGFVSTLRSDDVRASAWAASRILLLSSTYKRIVGVLNKKYVWSGDVEKAGGIVPFKPDDGGRFKAGRFAGRRMLAFSELTTGNRFIRGRSFELQTAAFPLSDHILLSLPMGAIVSDEARGALIAGLIGSIAHETVHAHHRITARPRGRLSRSKRAKAFIAEEVHTRTEERKILKQILSEKKSGSLALEIGERKAKGTGARSALKERLSTTTLARPDVERQFVSGTHLTYLEMFVFNDLIETSIRKRNLDSRAVGDAVNLAERLVFQRPIDAVVRSDHPGSIAVDPESGLRTPFMSETAELLVMRRAVDMHWQELDRPKDESILQQHVIDVFPPDIRYSPPR